MSRANSGVAASTSSMSQRRIGSNANGNDDVHRAANARKGLTSRVKSLMAVARPLWSAATNWK